MRRREFISLVGCVAAGWPLAAARAQKTPIRIGFMASGAATSANSAAQIDAIRQGLRDNGLIPGQDYLLEARFAAGDYQLFPQMARELAQTGARVLLVNTIASVRAAQNVSPSVAVVMLAINDPVATGLVASLARPGGQTTGMATMTEDLTPKLLDIQREVIPNARTIAVLYNPVNPTNPVYLDKLRASATGMTVLPFELTSPDGLDAAFSATAAMRPDALHVVTDSLINDLHDRIATFALAERLPSFSTLAAFAEFGGLISYGISLRQLFIRSGYFVKRILDGEKPGDLPVEQPTQIRLVINLKTARALDLAMPPALLARADEVIE
jgi:putative tryptophan/tyrosine transport system substrate-binding protein